MCVIGCHISTPSLHVSIPPTFYFLLHLKSQLSEREILSESVLASRTGAVSTIAEFASNLSSARSSQGAGRPASPTALFSTRTASGDNSAAWIRRGMGDSGGGGGGTTAVTPRDVASPSSSAAAYHAFSPQEGSAGSGGGGFSGGGAGFGGSGGGGRVTARPPPSPAGGGSNQGGGARRYVCWGREGRNLYEGVSVYYSHVYCR